VARTKHWREKQAHALARKKGKRPPYQRVLIVCEGAKTEPIYFDDIRKQNRVSSAHIRIIPADGTQPRQVVEFAEKTFLKTKEYDLVYAVFDRDDHTTYAGAINRVPALDGKLRNDERKPVRFVAVPSVPCFELWLLLHYADIQAFHHRDEIINRLGTYIPGYVKGMGNTYATTEPFLPQAVGRAQRLVARFAPLPGTDPYTRVHELVQLLRSIRPPGR
jgi:RloB-like protein